MGMLIWLILIRKLVEDLLLDRSSRKGTKKFIWDYLISCWSIYELHGLCLKNSWNYRTKLNNQMWRVCIADSMLQWKDLHDTLYDSFESFDNIVGH